VFHETVIPYTKLKPHLLITLSRSDEYSLTLNNKAFQVTFIIRKSAITKA